MIKNKSGLVALMILVMGSGFLANNASAQVKEGTMTKRQNYGFEKMMEAKAKILSIDKGLLIEKIKNGATFQDILSEKGLTMEWFAKQMENIKINEINQLLKEGKIDQAKANQLIEAFKAKKRDCSNSVAPRHGFKQGIGMGFGRNKNK